MNAFAMLSTSTLRRRWSWRRARESASVLACALLAAVSTIRPEPDLLRVAKGKPRLGGEMRHIETGGYYEQLIDGARLSKPDQPADESIPSPPGWVPFGAAGIVEPDSSYLRWRMKPNLDMVWNGARFRTNSHGYRTPEVTLEKPSDVYRIVVIGSSNTMGHGVADDEAYPRLLEAWLQGLPNLDRRVEVVNLAVSGDSPSQQLYRMELEAGRYHPDWILTDASVLDSSLEERHLEAVVRMEPPPPIPLGYVAAALRRSKVSAADSHAEFERKIRFEVKALLDGAYGGWSDYSRRTGAPLTVALLPRTDEKRENPVIRKLIHTYVSRYQLDCMDLTDAFGDLDVDAFRLSPWDKHPSVLGHRLIFEAIRDAVIARGSLPGWSPLW